MLSPQQCRARRPASERVTAWETRGEWAPDTGVSQVMGSARVKEASVCALSAQSCLTLFDPVDCSPPGSTVNGIFQARAREWVAISYTTRSSQSMD